MEDGLLTKQTVEKLLGRSLSTKEDEAFEEYINISKEELQDILNIQFDTVTENRIYDSRDGYRTLFVDPFTEISSVSVNDVAATSSDYRIAFNDRRTNDWYNSIIFSLPMDDDDDISVTATWGFGETMPNDIQLLWARMFVVTASAEVSGKDKVRSKSIEDFSVTYDTSKTPREQFMVDNARAIAKYQRPDDTILHGGC